jgi:hypothetical protein
MQKSSQRIVTVTLISFLTMSCGSSDESFVLSCDSEKSYESFAESSAFSEKSKENLSFRFEKKSLAEFNCEWTVDRIYCVKISENPEKFAYHTLEFDRTSGYFSAVRQTGWHSDPVRSFTKWRGECEKIKGQRF